MGVQVEGELQLDRKELDEFRDGVLLCQIVGVLEMSKIPCVTANPRSSASALHNIKKALGVLKKKQSVPLYLVYAEHEILRGNQGTFCFCLRWS